MPPPGGRPFDGAEGERAAGLYERVFLGYGDDSIAQVGGAHIACEWVSNVLTKVLQRAARRLPRAVDPLHPLRQADARAGGYRYYRNEGTRPRVRRRDGRDLRDLLASLRRVGEWAAERWPRGR